MSETECECELEPSDIKLNNTCTIKKPDWMNAFQDCGPRRIKLTTKSEKLSRKRVNCAQAMLDFKSS